MSPPAAAAVFVPVTPGQLRALHAIARARGWSRDDLHAVAGVASLKELSVMAAARLIERVQTADHQREWTPGEPDRATARHVLRNATRRQRNKLAALIEELGWSAEKGAGWLAQRHGIRDLARGIYSTRTASEAIYQLEQALLKDARKGRTSRPLGGVDRA